ncbi:hypothetical protein Tco_0859256 [Tanacetum coccineum]|uniref:Uncharacterized protein n=1 Tax=Tanacetum coccineum TaxID=301880 RepID=A0ABQ5BD84_9ASTR
MIILTPVHPEYEEGEHNNGDMPTSILALQFCLGTCLDHLGRRHELGELWDCQLGNLTAGKGSGGGGKGLTMGELGLQANAELGIPSLAKSFVQFWTSIPKVITASTLKASQHWPIIRSPARTIRGEVAYLLTLSTHRIISSMLETALGTFWCGPTY